MNYTIEKAERCEYEIKKSRFIATIMPITDLDDCKQKLQKIKNNSERNNYANKLYQ